MRRIVLLIVLLAVVESVGAQAPVSSALWGVDGEAWTAGSRLSDFSHVGYRSGEAPIPDLPVASRVTDFGAIPNDEIDDTAAFQKALEETASGAVLIPAGRYLLTDRVSIRRSGVVLRGEGAGETVLFFPKGLEHIDPKPTTNTGGRELSGYSWSDGFLGIRGAMKEDVLTRISAPAERGAMRVAVADPSGIAAGMEVLVDIRDDAEKSLIAYLYGGDPGNTENFAADKHRQSQVVRVVSVEGSDLVLDRPLRHAVRLEWSPTIRRFDVSVSGSGIESLTVEFPARTYGGHFTEAGYNAMTFVNVRDCWARDIQVVNADSGVHSGAWFCTYANFTFKTTADAVAHRGDFGHHGMSIGKSENLITGFDFQHKFIHDLTVSNSSVGNVFSNGKGVDLCLDHHKKAPNSNLYTNLDAGAGTRLWRSGGGANIGRHCGAWETFWNIRTAQQVKRQPGWNPDLVNFVGLWLEEPKTTSAEGVWVEPAGMGQTIAPANLHEAQLARRLAK